MLCPILLAIARRYVPGRPEDLNETTTWRCKRSRMRSKSWAKGAAGLAWLQVWFSEPAVPLRQSD